MPHSVWNILREELKAAVASEEFQVWLAPLQPAETGGEGLTLLCPNAFHLTWVRDHHLDLCRHLLGELGYSSRIALALNQEEGAAPAPDKPTRPRQLKLPRIQTTTPSLNRDFRFENFVTGGCNEFAWAAAKALAKGRNIYTNTLYLVSSTGLGKSHLTQAVGHQVMDSFPGARVAYLTVEEFTNQMVQSIRNKRMEEFKDRFRRNCDILLLEEVHFLAGKEKTQDELSYTLDALLNAGKRVVFTGLEPPEKLKGLNGQLKSRISCGVTVPIEAPDQPTRVRILDRMSQAQHVTINQQVLEYLASQITKDIRRLRAALMGLMVRGSLTRRPMDLSLAAEVLGQLTQDLKRMTPSQIRDEVARVYGLQPDILAGKSRKKTVTRPRNLAMFICRRHTDASYASIGKIFNRDHTTVMYGVNQVERGLDQEPKMVQELAFLEKRLGVAH